MNPETPNSQELFATVAQHKSTVQRHESALVQQETLMAKHSEVLSDLMTSVRQLFDRLPSISATTASVTLPDPRVLSPLAEPRLLLAYLQHNVSQEIPVHVMGSWLNALSRLNYNHLPSPQIGPRSHPPFWQGSFLGNSGLEGTGTLLFKLFWIWRGVKASLWSPPQWPASL